MSPGLLMDLQKPALEVVASPALCDSARMSNTQSVRSQLFTEMREIAVLNSLGSVLGWDERTQMPAKGTELRAEQLSMLAALIHQRFTSPKIGQWLAEVAGSNPDEDTAANVREWQRDYDRATK